MMVKDERRFDGAGDLVAKFDELLLFHTSFLIVQMEYHVTSPPIDYLAPKFKRKMGIFSGGGTCQAPLPSISLK